MSASSSVRRPRARRRGLRLGAVAAVGALVLAACNVTVDGNTFTALDAQEEAWYSNGDEPYVAVIQFRVTPGVPGSTSVRYLGNLQEIASGVDDGDSATIPDAMAATSFPEVRLRSLPNIVNGCNPEIVGAVTVAMESDNSPWSAINGIMNDVKAELDTQLRAQIEPLSFADIVTPGAAAARGSRRPPAASRLRPSPRSGEGVGIWFQSFGDPDDVIGFKVLFFVAVDSSLTAALDAQLAGLPSSIVGRALQDGPIDVDYSGDDATYRIRWDVTVGLD